MFAPGTPNTRPEIYAMGFRQPFTIDVDPAEPGTVVVGEYGPDANTNNDQRGPSGIVEWNHITGPGFFGWPFCTGDNSNANSYNRYEYATDTSGPRYDCAATTVPNESPNNTGLEELPTPEQADVWHKRSGGHPEEFGIPGAGSAGEPNSGAIYRYDPDNPSDTKWPEYFDGSWLILDRAHGWWREVRMKDDGSGPLKVNDFFQPNQFGQPSHNFAIPIEFGPDGSLYMGVWTGGCCRTLSEQQGRIVRIDYVGDQVDEVAPEIEATVNGLDNGSGAFVDRATVRFEASDDLSGVEHIEYSTDGEEWTRIENDDFAEPFVASRLFDETGAHEIAYRATDRGGNVSAEGEIAFEIVDGGSCEYLRSDEFSNPVIDTAKWGVRVDSPAHEAAIAGGQLTLPILDEIDGVRTGPLAFLGQQVPEGEWSATTRVTIAHETNWEQGGLMLWQSDGNFVKVGFTADGPGADQRRFELTADDPLDIRHFSTSTTVPADFPQTAWIRMYREGDIVTGEFAPDEGGEPGTWTKLAGERAISGPDPENEAIIDPPREGEGVLIGPYAGGFIDGPWTKTAAFDFVRFDPDEVECDDAEPPMTTAELNEGAPLPSYDGPVDVALSASDAGSGVDYTEYRIDSDEEDDWVRATNDAEDEPFATGFEVTGEGAHTVEYRSADVAGNVETAHAVEFEITGATGSPELGLAVSPKRKTVKAGQSATFRATVRNAGDGPTGKVRVCVNAPKAKVRIAGKACFNRGALEPASRAQAKFKVKPKRSARGKRVELRFSASSPPVAAERATATLKVRR